MIKIIGDTIEMNGEPVAYIITHAGRAMQFRDALQELQERYTEDEVADVIAKIEACTDPLADIRADLEDKGEDNLADKVADVIDEMTKIDVE